MYVDIDCKVIKVDTKRENYTVRIEKDIQYLRGYSISKQADVYDSTKDYPVCITDMYFTIDWEKDPPKMYLDVEIKNARKVKLPTEFTFRFYLIDEEDKIYNEEAFEISK